MKASRKRTNGKHGGAAKRSTMSIRSSKEIYAIIEKHLRSATAPMTCVDLMDISEIREEACEEFGEDIRITTNRLSDTLGFMWRRNLLTRYPSSGERGQMARWAYIWTAENITREPPQPAPPPSYKGRQGVNITEREDGVMIEFDKFYVFVRPKSE
jgi:hypothetical protein